MGLEQCTAVSVFQHRLSRVDNGEVMDLETARGQGRGSTKGLFRSLE